MTHRRIMSASVAQIAAFACLSIGILGCSSTARVDAPSWDPEKLGEKAMKSLDANTDGAIDGTELQKAPGLKSALNAIDTDNNKLITKQEIVARITAYKEVGIGMVPYVCAVYYLGKPLEHARVRLIPEDFLAGVIRPAIGKSNGSGYYYLKAEGNETPGIRVGIYRVEITSEQVQLPPKYNAMTQLGIEVSPGIASGSRAKTDVFELVK